MFTLNKQSNYLHKQSFTLNKRNKRLFNILIKMRTSLREKDSLILSKFLPFKRSNHLLIPQITLIGDKNNNHILIRLLPYHRNPPLYVLEWLFVGYVVDDQGS